MRPTSSPLKKRGTCWRVRLLSCGRNERGLWRLQLCFIVSLLQGSRSLERQGTNCCPYEFSEIAWSALQSAKTPHLELLKTQVQFLYDLLMEQSSCEEDTQNGFWLTYPIDFTRSRILLVHIFEASCIQQLAPLGVLWRSGAEEPGSNKPHGFFCLQTSESSNHSTIKIKHFMKIFGPPDRGNVRAWHSSVGVVEAKEKTLVCFKSSCTFATSCSQMVEVRGYFWVCLSDASQSPKIHSSKSLACRLPFSFSTSLLVWDLKCH